VTVTYVEVSSDLRHAKVHVSVMGDQTRQELSVRGLQSAAGFLQSKIAKRVDIRYTPRLTFVLDQGVKRSIEISRILKEVLPEPDASDAPDSPSVEPEPTGDDVITAAADDDAAPDETAAGTAESGTS
jgi:ribosome-binding factor A